MDKLKKRILWLICIASSIYLLSGCSSVDSYVESGEQLLEELLSANEETQVAPVQETLYYKPFVSAFETDVYYYYPILADEEDQTLYQEIYRILSCRLQETTVSTLDEERLKQIFEFVLLDHPELFYVEGYQYTRYYVDDMLSQLTLQGTYCMDEEETKDYWSQIQDVTDEIVTQVSELDDQYEQAKCLYEYLINETEYMLDAWNNQNICSVFIEKASVCQGYAKAYQYLMQKAGMMAVVVSGVANEEGHAWNLVKVDNAYYYVDPTWGDASYVMTEETNSDDNLSFKNGINYDFFLVTTEEIEKSHTPEWKELLPSCEEIRDNYYVRENLYLDAWDYSQVASIISNAKGQEQTYVTLKCKDEEIFHTLVDELIEKQKIFELIGYDDGGVAYAYDQNQYTFSVWF